MCIPIGVAPYRLLQFDDVRWLVRGTIYASLLSILGLVGGLLALLLAWFKRLLFPPKFDPSDP
jgi:hypothetical protein